VIAMMIDPKAKLVDVLGSPYRRDPGQRNGLSVCENKLRPFRKVPGEGTIRHNADVGLRAADTH
jgi:hypothetical protein